MKTTLILFILGISIAHAHAQQTVFRDSSGRTIGTASTGSSGQTVFRDSSGRTTATATPSLGGQTVFRDSSGRTTGTMNNGRR